MRAGVSGRTLIAGIGNVFLGDDGFGVETLRALSAHPLPQHVEAVDFGVRGVHLAYQLLDGYDTVVLVDATARGGAPGTLYLIEVGEEDVGAPRAGPPSTATTCRPPPSSPCWTPCAPEPAPRRPGACSSSGANPPASRRASG